MRVGQEHVPGPEPLLHQRLAERAQAGAAVEDQNVAAAPHLDAGGVPAVACRLGAGAGNASAHAPAPYEEVRTVGQSPLTTFSRRCARWGGDTYTTHSNEVGCRGGTFRAEPHADRLDR